VKSTNYPNWQKGFIVGAIGGAIATAGIFALFVYLDASSKPWWYFQHWLGAIAIGIPSAAVLCWLEAIHPKNQK
jgi:hypothetical protein